MRLPRFVKDSGTLISGSVAAQAVALLAYLLLTRLFTPDDFGKFNVFYSYIEVLVILSTLKYELAVVAAPADREAAAVARHALRLNAIVSLVLLAAISLLYLLGWLPVKLQAVGRISLLIPFLVFFCGTNRVYEMLFNRYRQFRQSALSQVVNALSSSLLKILFGLTRRMPVLGLPLGTVLGQMCGNANYRLRLHSLHLPETTRQEERQAARRHIDFARYTAPKDWLNSFSANLPFLWLAMYFDDAAIGLFGLALTFTFRPVNIITTAFENVFFVRVADKVKRRQPILSDINRFLVLLNAAAIPLLIVAYSVASPVFGFVFGKEWSQCGDYVRLLLPWMWVMLTTNSLMFMASVFGRQKYEFLFSLVLLCLRAAAIAVGLRMGSFEAAILLFSLATAAVNLALGIWYYTLAAHYEKKLKTLEP